MYRLAEQLLKLKQDIMQIYEDNPSHHRRWCGALLQAHCAVHQAWAEIQNVLEMEENEISKKQIS